MLSEVVEKAAIAGMGVTGNVDQELVGIEEDEEFTRGFERFV
jgi:hypothetical protein